MLVDLPGRFGLEKNRILFRYGSDIFGGFEKIEIFEREHKFPHKNYKCQGGGEESLY